MQITAEEVARVARLSCLSFDEHELCSMQTDLAKIFELMSVLEHFEDAKEHFEGCDLCSATRGDRVQPSFERSRLLENAAVRNEQGIVVPQTVE